ncbi:LacI family DNA-binding transcriptional regulator [Metabacillus iocasae]|uniref:DNA-binding LacI/PurR family transcriptional regulator n=1 Tax=Priestia iocasae TaxID=2291674 RepID=A0ABS2QY51_9BACI|nr:LacI family DNA-binding transcriptional regulator [Metabacillus iocasae]MBM7703666.1 DNA-binding LacI/PurR family transcriptional regulator [Metabacillus iocasae]
MGNIRDIAKKAGVSVSTVSRVLNHHPYVKEDKRQAVLKAIEEMNYTKNMNAVHLSKGQTFVVGVVLPYINQSYFSAVLEGIAEEALASDYQLMICQTNYEIKQEIQALEMLKMKQVDGLLICSRACDWEVIREYQMYGPIIVCEDGRGTDVSSVFIDHYAAFEKGLHHLIEQGHRRIGYCIGRRTGVNSYQRERAYRNIMNELGEPIREEWIFDQCLLLEDGERVASRLIKLTSRPTALLVTNDQVAAGLVLQCQHLGIRVPEDLAIIGFDNQSISHVLQLTTIELPLKELGRQLFQLFLHKDNVKHIEVSTQLIKRLTV